MRGLGCQKGSCRVSISKPFNFESRLSNLPVDALKHLYLALQGRDDGPVEPLGVEGAVNLAPFMLAVQTMASLEYMSSTRGLVNRVKVAYLYTSIGDSTRGEGGESNSFGIASPTRSGTPVLKIFFLLSDGTGRGVQMAQYLLTC